jgi:murein DD-endopeptidase MepM/ murein hydrolase activator NlpD
VSRYVDAVAFDDPSRWPVDDVTVRRSSSGAGADLEGIPGQPVYPVAAGGVVSVGQDAARGYYVAINHGSSEYVSVYSHLRGPATVNIGDTVDVRRPVGVLGDTLHLDLSERGVSVDPHDVIGGSVSAVAVSHGKGLIVVPRMLPDGTTAIEGLADRTVYATHEQFPLTWPLKGGVGLVTSDFGPYINPFSATASFHKGIDIAWANGTPVVAAQSATVRATGVDVSEGNWIQVSDGALETYYSHLGRVDAHAGMLVTAGSVIGRVGTTGVTTGPHLHFEVRWQGHLVNPLRVVPETEITKGHVGEF